MNYEMFDRRAAAISFLSNISLDGSSEPEDEGGHENSNLSNNDVFDNFCLSIRQDDLDKPCNKSISPVNKYPPEPLLFNSSADSNTVFTAKFLDSEFSGPFRERTSTVGSEYGSEKHFGSLIYKKRLLQQIPDDKSHGIFSSSESMISNTVIMGSQFWNLRHNFRTEVLSPNNEKVPSGSRKDFQVMTLSKSHKLRGQRLVLVSQHRKNPVAIFSVIPYNKLKGEIKPFTAVRRRNTSGPRPLSAINDALDPWQLFGMERTIEGHEVSYGQLLAPSKYTKIVIVEDQANKHTTVARCYSHDSGTYRPYPNSPPIPPEKVADICHTEYDPNLLDDPELIAGKHRTLLPFKSYITSVIHYVRAADLKKELNDKFKERFPSIELTLSKLRSIKREMRKIAYPDLLTTAYAYVYFERLIHRDMITKENRKLCAGASLILAAKLNDIKGEQLKHLIEALTPLGTAYTTQHSTTGHYCKIVESYLGARTLGRQFTRMLEVE